MAIVDLNLNFSVNQVEDVLKNTSNDDFKRQFNRDKPNHDQQLVFSCRLGARALKASEMASGLGYTKYNAT